MLKLIRAILNRAHKEWGWLDSAPIIRMRKEENKQALDIIQAQKGKNAVYVFTYNGKAVTRCNNHAWRNALTRANIENFCRHDLGQTWAS